MIRNNKFYKSKEIRKLLKQYNESWGYYETVVLNDYYHNGWDIYYTLRDDILNRDDSNLILEIVNFWYNSLHITNSGHLRLVKKGIFEVIKNYNSLSLLPSNKYKYRQNNTNYTGIYENKIKEEYKKYFKLCYNQLDYYTLNIPQYWLKVRWKKHYSNKVTIINPDKQSTRNQLLNKIQKNDWFNSNLPSEARIWGYKSKWDKIDKNIKINKKNNVLYWKKELPNIKRSYNILGWRALD